jgi:hypothetical protein
MTTLSLVSLQNRFSSVSTSSLYTSKPKSEATTSDFGVFEPKGTLALILFWFYRNSLF